MAKSKVAHGPITVPKLSGREYETIVAALRIYAHLQERAPEVPAGILTLHGYSEDVQDALLASAATKRFIGKVEDESLRDQRRASQEGACSRD